MKKLSSTFLLIILIFSNSVFAGLENDYEYAKEDKLKVFEYQKKCRIEINFDFTIINELKTKHVRKTTTKTDDNCMTGFKDLLKLSDEVIKINSSKDRAVELNALDVKFSIVNVKK
jgi:hypothetical protein